MDLDENPVYEKVAVKTLSRIEDLDSVEAFLREGKYCLFSNYIELKIQQ